MFAFERCFRACLTAGLLVIALIGAAVLGGGIVRTATLENDKSGSALLVIIGLTFFGVAGYEFYARVKAGSDRRRHQRNGERIAREILKGGYPI